MKDEFDKIMDLFALSAEQKENHLDEIFHLSIAFIEKYKDMKDTGSKEEQEDISKKLLLLREKISEENARSETILHLSKEEIKQLSSNKDNFTPEQWDLLQKTKQSIISQRKSKGKLISNPEKKISSKRKKSSWLKS
jgi:hypothetical protein